MQSSDRSVSGHYTRENIYETILHKLKEQGIEKDKVTRKDISSVDEFHIKGAEISLEIAHEGGIKEGQKILDAGCGIGGPARMLADVFECNVTGVDLTEEFIRTATLLSELVSLNHLTEFIAADATQLPFANETFDVVWTQHAQMNIRDKNQLYSELFRVLKKEGKFIYYDIFSTGKKDLIFPLPWADDDSINFLITTDDYEKLLTEIGFIESAKKNRTNESIEFFNNAFENNKKAGQPKLGLNVLMTEQTSIKLSNLNENLKENKLCVQSGIYLKH
ncbi:MAG: class I SAM-dependent methyltransferase [Ignavibacteriae bacterium]|nr:class I SAM-dependent methyltransferase [Ignavibacteriota bacterium]